MTTNRPRKRKLPPRRAPGTQPAKPAPPAPWSAPALALDHALAPLTPPNEFLTAAAELGIEFDEADVPKLGKYLALLLRTNTTINLTAIRDEREAWTRHILDSLTLIPALADLPAHARVIDVGSGGGLPGLPLAITLPQLRFTLLEATGKKAEFLRQAAAALELSNVEVLQKRAEQAGQFRGDKVSRGATTSREGGTREAFDAVIARAVGPLPVLAELTVPFAKIGGRVLLIKGERAEQELADAAGALHLLKAVHASTLTTPTGRIIALEKTSATPRTYPRADGEPKRAPLGVSKARESGAQERDAE